MKLFNLISCCLLLQGCTALAQPPARAQSMAPVQTKTFFGQGGTDYDITLDQPVRSGDAIIVEVYAAQGLPWEASITCDTLPQWCNWYMLDSQGNRFQRVDEDQWAFWYIPAAKGGQETISVYYSTGNNISVVAMEFPVSLMLVDVTPPRCDENPPVGSQPLCETRRGTNSYIFQANTSTPTSYSITSSFNNELFIGYGQLGGRFQTFTGLNGWSDPVWGTGEVYINYLLVPTAGTAVADTLSVSPALGAYPMYMTIAGFKTAAAQ